MNCFRGFVFLGGVISAAALDISSSRKAVVAPPSQPGQGHAILRKRGGSNRNSLVATLFKKNGGMGGLQKGLKGKRSKTAVAASPLQLQVMLEEAGLVAASLAIIFFIIEFFVLGENPTFDPASPLNILRYSFLVVASVLLPLGDFFGLFANISQIVRIFEILTFIALLIASGIDIAYGYDPTQSKPWEVKILEQVSEILFVTVALSAVFFVEPPAKKQKDIANSDDIVANSDEDGAIAGADTLSGESDSRLRQKANKNKFGRDQRLNKKFDQNKMAVAALHLLKGGLA